MSLKLYYENTNTNITLKDGTTAPFTICLGNIGIFTGYSDIEQKPLFTGDGLFIQYDNGVNCRGILYDSESEIEEERYRVIPIVDTSKIERAEIVNVVKRVDNTKMPVNQNLSPELDGINIYILDIDVSKDL